MGSLGGNGAFDPHNINSHNSNDTYVPTDYAMA